MRAAFAACAALIIVLQPGWVAAQGACVECIGPDRGYNCTVKDGERAQQFRGGQRALELVCLSELARVGGHEICRLRTGYSGPCIGQPHEVDVSQIGKDAIVVGKPAKAENAAAGSPPPAVAAQPAPAPAKGGPPETLEQLARQTMTKSKEQLSNADETVRKAGGAVGGAAKQTWDCITSLFKRC